MTDQAPDTTETETTETDQSTETETETETPNREAAKYRRQLREAEAERDRLAQAVDQLRRREVERASGLRKPDGLWKAGAQVAQFYSDEGELDTDAIGQFAHELGLNQVLTPDPSQGSGHGSTPSRPSFSDAFRPR